MSKASRQRALAGFEDDAEDSPASGDNQPPAGKPTGARSKATAADGPPDLAGKTVFVVDAHSLIYQVFHALPEMSSPTGQPVGAVHGFIRDIVDLLENKRPEYLFCAFDPKGDVFRNRLYPEYKANRESMPEDLRLQIPLIRRMLEALGVPVLVVDDFEADDVLATLARRVEQYGGDCVLVTSDKDCRQLISDHVKMYNIRKDELIDAAGLHEVWGIRPEQVVDFQALVGDSTDNIPGVPLIGPKIARELIEKYGTLEEILDHAGELSGKKRRENLIAFREQALLSRQLVRLSDDAPVEIDWPAGRVGGFDKAAVEQLCLEFGFRRLAERLDQLTVASAPAAWQADYRLVASAAELQSLADEMAKQPHLVIDTETTSVNPRWAEIVGYSFAWSAGKAYYAAVRAPQGDPQIDPAIACRILKPVLENPAIAKIGQNLKYDTIVLRGAGIEMAGLAFDTMVADYLLDPGERNHSLDDLAKRYLNHDTIKISELIGTGRKQKQMDEVPVEQVAEYAAEDADVPLRLFPPLQKRLRDEGLSELFEKLEMPLIEVLAEMEFNGVKVDTARLKEMSKRFGARLAELEADIFELAGGSFNIDSPKQLAKVLFDDLKLPIIKRTKTGASTDVEVLTELAKQHELPAKIIDYRQNAKLKSTYVDALPLLVHPQTGRVHTSFKQDVAATGRLSSTEPNLQNIPIRTAAGREIRSAFLPDPPGWRLLAADYSQIELRVLAHFSGDEALVQAFLDDRDIHAQVASEVSSVPLEEVTPEMRRRAKAVNFGVIYGQSAFGLAKALDIDKDEAAEFIDAYFSRYRGVDAFMSTVLDNCRETGYVSTILGRRRAIQGVRSSSHRGDTRQRNLPERIAINTVIQGSAADLIKQAMINVRRRMQRESLQARMLLQIHDELVFETPPAELDQLAALVAEEMGAAASLKVPLKVDLKAGANWAECEPV